MRLVATQLSVPGSYLPPVLSMRRRARPRRSFHCLSIPPWAPRAAGALVVLVAVQLSVPGLYLPASVQKAAVVSAPDDHFAVVSTPRCAPIAPDGALVVLVAVQLSVLGLYLPPVFK